MSIAIIGTAGRDPLRPMDKALWLAMLRDVRERVPQGASLVSGGAAWADHLAVVLFLDGHASELTLHLPSRFPLVGRFPGGPMSAGATANRYHDAFSRQIDRDPYEDIRQAVIGGAKFTTQPLHMSYRAFLIRNIDVAKEATSCIAYTWAKGATPADGGTSHTWSLMKCPKTHVPLSTLIGDL